MFFSLWLQTLKSQKSKCSPDYFVSFLHNSVLQSLQLWQKLKYLKLHGYKWVSLRGWARLRHSCPPNPLLGQDYSGHSSRMDWTSAQTWWYLADRGRMPAVSLVAVRTLDKNGTVAEALGKHLPSDVVQPHTATCRWEKRSVKGKCIPLTDFNHHQQQ